MASKLNPVQIFHDYWDADGNRHKAPAVIELPLKEAKQMIAAGKGERADPMPSEQD